MIHGYCLVHLNYSNSSHNCATLGGYNSKGPILRSLRAKSKPLWNSFQSLLFATSMRGDEVLIPVAAIG